MGHPTSAAAPASHQKGFHPSFPAWGPDQTFKLERAPYGGPTAVAGRLDACEPGEQRDAARRQRLAALSPSPRRCRSPEVPRRRSTI